MIVNVNHTSMCKFIITHGNREREREKKKKHKKEGERKKNRDTLIITPNQPKTNNRYDFS